LDKYLWREIGMTMGTITENNNYFVKSMTVIRNDIGWENQAKIFPVGYTFNFKPGLNIIVGENGSGKSTLMNLMSRKYDDDSSTVNFIKAFDVSDFYIKLL
jgi:ABC-type multidrug transport system fused ATPase/permease subunit